jgi:hypothetical protein
MIVSAAGFGQTARDMARQRAATGTYTLPQSNRSAGRSYYGTRTSSANRYGTNRYSYTARPYYRPGYQRSAAAGVPASSYLSVKKYKVLQVGDYASDASKLEMLLNRMLRLGWKYKGNIGSLLIFYK